MEHPDIYKDSYSSTDDAEREEKRKRRREAFMESVMWEGARLEPLPADASFRRYYRVHGGKRPALLMEDPPDRPPMPPYVMVQPFMTISSHLRSLGLSAPTVFAQDADNGLLLIEDFGEDTFTRLLDAGEDPAPMFELAVDTLVELHKNLRRSAIELEDYDFKALVDEAMLFLDWYYLALTGEHPSDEMRRSFSKTWIDLFKQLPKDQDTIVLRDFHVDNLMRLPDREGVAACGLLDFQDALHGQFAYDLMSLLEDARRDMDEKLRAELFRRYVAGMGDAVDEDALAYAFRVLAAQRHAKVLGIFVRLYKRDGKDKYLRFLPHVRKLMLSSLADPVLKPMRDWLDSHNIDLEKEISPE